MSTDIDIDVDKGSLETRANVLRARLSNHLAALNQRLSDSIETETTVVIEAEPSSEAKPMPRTTQYALSGMLFGAGATLAVAGGAAMAAYRIRNRRWHL